MKKFKYQKIAEQIEDEILNCEYEAGDKLASALQISRDFDVHSQTANNAIDLLEDRGLIEKEYNHGAYIADNARDKVVEMRKDKIRDRIKKLFNEAIKLGLDLEEELNQLDCLECEGY